MVRRNWKLIVFIILAEIIGYLLYQFYFLYKDKKLDEAADAHPNTYAIYIVYHKMYPILESDIVIPIQAGRALRRSFGLELEDLMIGDDTGDNISLKNDRYAELTVTYWMWKNAPKTNYVGLMHYRRIFANNYISKKCGEDDYLCMRGLTQHELDKLMLHYDIVVPNKSWVGVSVYNHYKYAHHVEDLNLALLYIKKHYPEMKIAAQNVMSVDYFNNANTFIMKREIFDEYAAWLFDILFAIEKDMSHDMKGYNVRAPGFLAERLFNIWLEFNRAKYRIGEISMVWV